MTETATRRGRRPKIDLPEHEQLWRALQALRGGEADRNGHLPPKPGMVNIIRDGLSDLGATQAIARKLKLRLESLGLLARDAENGGYVVDLDLTESEFTPERILELEANPKGAPHTEDTQIPTLDQWVSRLLNRNEDLERALAAVTDQRDVAYVRTSTLEDQLEEAERELAELRGQYLSACERIAGALPNSSSGD